MSTFKLNGDGMRRLSTEEVIESHEGLADRIAYQVTNGLRAAVKGDIEKCVKKELAAQFSKMQQQFLSAAVEAANAMVEKLAAAASMDATQAITQAVRRMEETSKECFHNLNKVLDGAEATVKLVRDCHEVSLSEMKIVAKQGTDDIKKAGLFTLSKMIGAEVDRYDIQKLIGEELRAAVTKALNPTKRDEGKSTAPE